MKNLRKIYQIVKPTRKYMVLLTVLSLLSSAEMIVYPYISRNLINSAVDLASKRISVQNSIPIFTFLIITLAGVTLAGSLVNIFNSYFQTIFTTMFEKLLRTKLFSHLTTLSIEYFENEKIGRVTNKISRGISRSSNLLQTLSNWMLSQMINYIVVIVIFFYLNIYIGLICIFVSAIFIVVSWFMTKRLKPMHKKINRRADNLMGRQIEVLSNMHVVRNFAMEKREVREFEKESGTIASMYNLRAKKRLKYATIRNFLSALITISTLSISVAMVIKGKMTTGDIFLVQAYVQYIQWPLWNFSWIYDEAVESMRSIDDIAKILDTNPSVKDKPNAAELVIKNGDIEFQKVTFNYKGKKEQTVFKDLSFIVPGGESVALVGPSGVGKSTIIKLLSRLYDPQKGKILIDGQNIKDLKQESYRKNLAVVSQQTVLFNDTIKNNIRYGNLKATQNEVFKASKAANIHQFIIKLPQGYNTLVGEKGIKLSGGEAQRISIARAILKNPKILVLDEATSSLDSQSEKLVQDALWKLIEGRTTFIIAHRLSTVMKADEILVIDNGEIIERGNHSDLIKKKGLYADLFKLQSGAFLFAEGVEKSKLNISDKGL